TADTDAFVYDPDAEVRSRTDRRAFLILGATVAVALAIGLWLWLAWRRRPAVETAAAAPAEAPAPPQPGPPQAADLNDLLARLERTMRQRAGRRIGFRVSLLPEPWRCRVEPPAVESLVLDLVAAAAADL